MAEPARRERRPRLPTGTVTFLLTDIAASTSGWESDRIAMAEAVARHYAILDDAVRACRRRPAGGAGGGRQRGGGIHAGHRRVARGRRCAMALRDEPWPPGAALRVRMAVHTGEVALRDERNYFGPAVIRCARLRAVAHGGQIVCSRATADLAADDLPSGIELIDLGSHRLKDLGRPEQVYEVTHPDLPEEFPVLRSLDSVPNNLPLQLTSFVGRERELAEIRRLVGQHRLVTLTGSGGVGKTRLAGALAGDLAAEHPDGAWWIELAPLSEGTRVATEVLTVLRVPDAAGRPAMQQLTGYLAARQVLLVLDNCEHLLDDCAALGETLLRSCPGVAMLATSREPLDVPGEFTWRVPPMGLPVRSDTPEVVPLDSYDAVALFVERALAARPNFTVTNDTAPAVAELCARLDGIPLAIELAAARTRVMSVAEILDALTDRFHLLTGGSRKVMPRQQTLEASVAWSHDLLDSPERTLLRRLGVFQGGFTLSAAEAVCADATLPALGVLDVLDALAAKSLVVVDVETRGASRFRLLETVRAFAARKLDEAGETAAVRDAHLRHYLDVAAQAETALLAASRAVIDAVSVELDNCRAAAEWALTGGDADAALRLARRLGFVLVQQGRNVEAQEWTTRALALGSGAPGSVGWARWILGYAQWNQGDVESAQAAAEAVIALGAEAGDDALAARGHQLGYWLQVWLDRPSVLASTAQSAALAERCGDAWVLMDVTSGYTYDAMHRGNLAEAARWAEEGRRRCLAGGNDYMLAWAYGGQAAVAVRQGDLAAAQERGFDGLRLGRELGDPVVGGWGALGAAEAQILAGRPAAAAATAEDVLQWSREVGTELIVAGVLGVAGRARWAAGDDSAEALLREAMDATARVGDTFLWGSAALTLARLLIARGDASMAPAVVEEGLTAIGAERSTRLEAEVAEARALLAAAAGDHAEIALRTMGRIHDVNDFNRIVLTYKDGAAITFADVGRVQDTRAGDSQRDASGRGRHVHSQCHDFGGQAVRHEHRRSGRSRAWRGWPRFRPTLPPDLDDQHRQRPVALHPPIVRGHPAAPAPRRPAREPRRVPVHPQPARHAHRGARRSRRRSSARSRHEGVRLHAEQHDDARAVAGDRHRHRRRDRGAGEHLPVRRGEGRHAEGGGRRGHARRSAWRSWPRRCRWS